MARHKSSSKHKHKHKKHKHSQSDDESSGSDSSSAAPAGVPGRKTEGELKTENRNAILQRSRMWQTVGSDDEDEEDDEEKKKDKPEGKEASPGKHGHHHKHHHSGSHHQHHQHHHHHHDKHHDNGKKSGDSDRHHDGGDRHDRHRNVASASKDGHEGRGRKRSREDDRVDARAKDRGGSASSSASSSSSSSTSGGASSSSGSDDDGSSSSAAGSSASSSGGSDDERRSRSKGHRSSKHGGRGRDKKKSDDKSKSRKKRRSSLDSGHKKARSSSSRKEKKKHRDRSRDDSKKRRSSSKSKKKKRGKDKDRDSSKKKDKKSKDKDKGAPGFGNVKMAGAVDQDAYGKNGVLREADYFNKQREFEVWMMEQKKIFDTGGMPKWETKQYFREYMEDFNTCTLPHEKFIDLEKWEMAEYNRKKADEAKRRASGSALSMREDEMEMNLKKRKAREAANAKFDNLVKASIRGSKRENMQNQDLLRAEMQNAYKTGDMERVKRIEKRLEPDEMEGWR